jgi:hypothetical protein
MSNLSPGQASGESDYLLVSADYFRSIAGELQQ